MTVLLPLPDHRPDPMVISVRRPHLDIGSSTNLKKGTDFGDDRRGQSHVGSAQSTEVLAKKGFVCELANQHCCTLATTKKI
jgi:hypothetical protein